MSRIDIRDNLRMVIKDKGYTQSVIARRANLTPMKLCQILNKERKLEANELFDVCDAIEMSPDCLRMYVPKNEIQEESNENR